MRYKIWPSLFRMTFPVLRMGVKLAAGSRAAENVKLAAGNFFAVPASLSGRQLGTTKFTMVTLPLGTKMPPPLHKSFKMINEAAKVVLSVKSPSKNWYQKFYQHGKNL